MKTFSLFVFLLLAGFPIKSGAQSRIALAIGAGASLPLGRLRDTQTSGRDFELGFIRGSDEAPIGVRIDFGYDQLPGKAVNGVKQPERRTVSGTANVVFSLSGYSFKPYLLGGAGGFRMTSNPAAPDQRTKFGFDFGIGFTVPIGAKAVFVESRVNSIAQHNAKPVRYVPIIFGFLF